MRYAPASLLLIAACGSPDRDETADAAKAPAATAAAPAAPPADTVPTETPEAAPPATAAPVLAVDGEGLRLINPRNGSATPLAFGLAADAVIAPLERLRGEAATGRNADCGAYYANWADGLSLVFRDGKFAGWSLDRRAQGAITTMSGVGPGATRAALDAAYAATVTPSTLGIEFSAGGLGGLLTGPGADATVTDLWAGSTCVAR